MIVGTDRLLHDQQLIGSHIGKLLRDSFGKGPESVYVAIGDTFITVYLRNFLSPAERVLLGQDQEPIVEQTRDKLMQAIKPEIIAYIEAVTGIRIREFYVDWGLHNRSGIFVGISREPWQGSPPPQELYTGKAEVEQVIHMISKEAEKAPEELYLCELNPRTLLVIRKGILVRIEKELIRLGHGEVLRYVKRNLEKTYLHNTGLLDRALQRQIVDSFVDWDFELDKSAIVLVLNPRQLSDQGHA